MSARVVTVTCQAGTNGPEIADLASSKLGYAYHCDDIPTIAAKAGSIGQAAIRSAERLPNLFVRFGEVLQLADGEQLPYESAWVTSHGSRTLIESTIRDLARSESCVIAGHAAEAILAAANVSTFSVLVTGSPNTRAEAQARLEQVSLREAARSIERIDAETGAYLKHVYNVHWLRLAQYQLIVSVDGLDVESAAELIANAARRWRGRHASAVAKPIRPAPRAAVRRLPRLARTPAIVA